MIKSFEKEYDAFVETEIQEIQKLTNAKEWF